MIDFGDVSALQYCTGNFSGSDVGDRQPLRHVSGMRKRLVRKRVVLADVPLYRNFLKKSSPAMLPGQKKAMFFEIPGPRKTGTRVHSENCLTVPPPNCWYAP